MTETAASRPMSRWLRVLLVVSLAFNLLILGLIGGWAMKWGKHGPHHMSRIEQLGGPMTRALDDADRRAIGRQMRAASRGEGGNRAERHATIAALITELRKEEFDRDAAEALMAAQRGHLTDRLALGQSLLLDRLASMAPAARAAYADRLQDGLDRRKSR